MLRGGGRDRVEHAREGVRGPRREALAAGVPRHARDEAIVLELLLLRTGASFRSQ